MKLWLILCVVVSSATVVVVRHRLIGGTRQNGSWRV
jgi:hypothetical protein